MMFSNRDLTKLIVPIMMEQIFSIAIGMVDSVMVSGAGEAAISGVSLVGSVNVLFVYVFSALSAGGTVVISQLYGRGDNATTRSAVKQLLWVVFAVAFAITLGVVVFREPLLSMIFGSIDKDVMKNAQEYFLFTALSYPFMGIYSCCAAVFRIMGNSKVSMIISTAINILNAIGNAILIMGFHMGAAGAAISTLFCNIIGMVIMIILLYNKNNDIYIDKIFKIKLDMTIIKNICAIGIPNGLENGMFQLGKILTQSLVATFGTVQIAANAVANSISSLMYVPGSAISVAMVTVIGRCIGAGEKEQAKKYTFKLMSVIYALIIVVVGLTCVFIRPIVGVYNLSPEVSDVAVKLILFISVFMCTLWPMACTLPSAFKAASDVKYTMVISVLSMWVFRVGASYVFGKYMGLGIIGVWLAMAVDWGFKAVLYVIRYLRGTWITKYKIV